MIKIVLSLINLLHAHVHMYMKIVREISEYTHGGDRIRVGGVGIEVN